MRIFTLIWLGQLVSLIGTWMAVFALDIWVFQKTGSATQFALVTLTCTIPPIIISPLAGTLVDRWDRRWTMIISHLCIGLSTLVIVALLTIGQLEIWHIYLRNVFISTFGAFHSSAYKASIRSLVSEEDLTRVSGMMQLSMGIQQIVSPLLAGILLNIVQLKGILLINLATLLVALVPLLLVPFPKISQPADEKQEPLSFWGETAYGWTYLTERPGLLKFLIVFSIYQFLLGFVAVLMYPLILSLATPASLGQIAFVGGIGTLVGALIMSAQKNSWKNLIIPILSAMSLSGLWIALAGLRPSTIQIAIATSLFFLTAPFINGSVQVIFQKQVAERVQGRVFALIGSISGIAIPLAALIAGPLADDVFEPLMAFDGPWSRNLIGQVIGSGPGRGIGLIFVLVGCCILVAALLGYQYPGIRELEENLPDA
ncbi:MFS transporter [Plectonema radiosum NIES-515]|uniref:MFS transporter n=1 Tax=Plectonema radiosum NIES-515 TaxID=2986073 RepID=A0ABT3B7M7_9CYAN|nr:MFS transporter [Plectonema radiosum]MCV3217385.1 MFS transporter [Plectonema radiosum NIES-515]